MGSYNKEVRHYLTPAGRDPYQAWLESLRDLQGKIAIVRRVDRLEIGNPGDHAFCREGVWELRIDHGPGYRVHYGTDGHRIVLLLGGGDKDSQARDIERAVAAWRDYEQRKHA